MDELTQRAHKRWQEVQAYWGNQYNHSRDLLAFRDGRQWDTGVLAQRTREMRPCEVLNFTKTYCNRIVNPFLQTPIGASVDLPEIDPLDYGIELPAGVQLENLLVGIVSMIEDRSGAKEAYFTAFESAVACGLGFWRLGSEYCDDEGTEQEIKVFKVDEFDAVWIDPASKKNDASDARYAFFRGEMAEDEARDMIEDYRKDTRLDIGGRTSCKKGFVPDVLYYEVVTVKFWRYYSDDGMMTWDELPEGIAFDRTLKILTDGTRVIPATRRRIERKECKVYRFVDSYLVEESTLAMEHIGVVRVVGDKIAEFAGMDTGVYYTGAVRWLMPFQKQVNYHGNNELELSGNAPKSPWITPAKAVENYPEWQTANVANYSNLTYDHIDEETGNPIPAPFRADNTAQTGPSMASKMQSIELMGRGIGITEAMLGELQTGAESGKAVFLRNKQGEISTAHYSANLEQSVAYCSDLIIDMIPTYYDTERDFVVNIGGKSKVVRLNLSQILTKDLRKFIKTKVSSGPSMEAKRREGYESLMMLASMIPEYAKAFIVPLVEATGAQNAEQVVKTLQTIDPVLAPSQDQEIPAEIQAILDAEAQDSAELEQQLQIMAQERAQMVRLIEQLQNELQSSAQDNATKLAIAEANNQTKIETELIKQGAETNRQDQQLSADMRKEIMAMFKELMSKSESKDDESSAKPNENDDDDRQDLSENVKLNKQTLVRGGTEFATPVETDD